MNIFSSQPHGIHTAFFSQSCSRSWICRALHSHLNVDPWILLRPSLVFITLASVGFVTITTIPHSRETRNECREMGTFDVSIQVADLDGQYFEVTGSPGRYGSDVHRSSPIRPTETSKSSPQTASLSCYASGERIQLDLAQVRVRLQGRETITWVVFGEDAGGAMLGHTPSKAYSSAWTLTISDSSP